MITEGLTGYLAPDDLAGLWTPDRGRRCTAFPHGVYLSDLHLGGTPPPEVRVFRLLLSAFVRGGVYLHFADAAAAQAALLDAGFDAAQVAPARPPDSGRGETAHILEASTIPRGSR